MADLQRPGGELASRPIHFFWVVDCSGSMSYDGKMEVVNTAIEECIPEMASAADNNPSAQLLIRALQFSSGASWLTAKPVPEPGRPRPQPPPPPSFPAVRPDQYSRYSAN